MILKGKRIAVLAENLYQELELWYPVLRMQEAGAEVRVIGPKKGETYKSKNGYPVTADLGSDEATVSTFDAVIVPGGYAPDLMRRDTNMVRFVREMSNAGKVVAAICHAGWVPISAGIYRGKTVTSVHSIRDDCTNAGASWKDAEVVVDGTLITSRVPSDLPAFCRAIIDALTRVPAAVR
jgi:protease I